MYKRRGKCASVPVSSREWTKWNVNNQFICKCLLACGKGARLIYHRRNSGSIMCSTGLVCLYMNCKLNNVKAWKKPTVGEINDTLQGFECEKVFLLLKKGKLFFKKVEIIISLSATVCQKRIWVFKLIRVKHASFWDIHQKLACACMTRLRKLIRCILPIIKCVHRWVSVLGCQLAKAVHIYVHGHWAWMNDYSADQ